MGANGSGKSTLAKIVAGHIPVTRGTRQYQDADLKERSLFVTFEQRAAGPGTFHQARWHAGLETSAPAVRDLLSASAIRRQNPYEVVTSPKTPTDFPELQARTISQLELEQLLDRRVDQLSDGEWRRVRIARALLKAPRLLVLDNPFVGLDACFREQIARVLASVADDGTEIYVVASEISEVPGWTSHFLILAQGRVIAKGPRDQVLTAEEAVRVIGATPPHDHIDGPRHLPPSSRPSIIEMRRVNITHGSLEVLREIDWTVREGDRWALIGPNGAGKTTLLSLILGDHPQAYANRIKLFGTQRGSGESIWEIKRRIGWVAPELHRYWPPQTACFEVVASGFYDTLGLYRGCTPAQEEMALAWMTRLGIERYRDQPLYRLSKGRQRLALIARALVKAPELLVLDEPCQGLDPHHRADVLQAIETMMERSEATVIYVSHRQEALPAGLTHLLELDKGTIVRREPLAGNRPAIRRQTT
jgi:molybdate transport system ATP-binding protein